MEKEVSKSKYSSEFKKYWEPQLKLARSIVVDKSLAEKVCQEAWVMILKRTKKLKKDEVWPYIRTATIHACYNEERKRYLEKRILNEFKDIFVPHEIIYPVTAAMIKDIVLTSLKWISEGFSTLDAKIFLLRYFQGLTSKEIAEKLNISRSTVTRHNRAQIEYLRNKLDDSLTQKPPQVAMDRLKHEKEKSISIPQISTDDILNWWPDIPSPPPRMSMPVTLKVKDCGRAQPSPIEDPWS